MGLLEEIEAGLDPDDPFGRWETQPDGERKWVADEATPERVAERAMWRPDHSDVATFDHLFRTRHGNFDVVPEISGTYDMLVKRAVRTSPHGHDILVVHIDELLAALTLPLHPKDVPGGAAATRDPAAAGRTGAQVASKKPGRQSIRTSLCLLSW